MKHFRSLPSYFSSYYPNNVLAKTKIFFKYIFYRYYETSPPINFITYLVK